MMWIMVCCFRYFDLCIPFSTYMKVNGNNMINLRLPCYLLFSFSLYSITGLSQEDSFKISGQYRVRSEYRHGYKTLMTDTVNAAFFIAQRARLIFAYKKNNLTAYSSIQDL